MIMKTGSYPLATSNLCEKIRHTHESSIKKDMQTHIHKLQRCSISTEECSEQGMGLALI